MFLIHQKKIKGTLIVHPAKEGSNLINEKDAEGRSFIEEMIEKKERTNLLSMD